MAKYVELNIVRKAKGESGTIIVHATGDSAFDTGFGMEHFCWGEYLHLDRMPAAPVQLSEKKFEFSLKIAWDNSYRFRLKLKDGESARLEVVGDGLWAGMFIYEKNENLLPEEGEPLLSLPEYTPSE